MNQLEHLIRRADDQQSLYRRLCLFGFALAISPFGLESALYGPPERFPAWYPAWFWALATLGGVLICLFAIAFPRGPVVLGALTVIAVWSAARAAIHVELDWPFPALIGVGVWSGIAVIALSIAGYIATVAPAARMGSAMGELHSSPN